MNLPPHLLDQWLTKYAFSDTPLPYNLASSTGPRFTVAEVLALGVGCDVEDVVLSYGPPDGHKKLREAIADFHGVDPDWVVVTTGASEALSILFCLASAPGAAIALPNLQFPAFDALAGAWGLKANHYALEKEDGFSQNAENVMSAVGTPCVLALVNTPHNPTGAVMERREVETLARELKSQGTPLIVDEIYHPLYFSTHFASAATIDNVIVVGDMSKVFSLPGLRTGWLIDNDSERRKRIIDARSYFSISSSPLLEAIAAHALRNRDQIIDRLEVVSRENLGHLTEFMTRTSNTLGWVAPQGGTTAFPWFNDGRDARPFCEAAARAGVLIAPGDCFRAPRHMRMGFGAQAKGYETALSILSEVLRDVSS
jgi:aspartate/methionine/tyrosine aminotransferase